MSGIAPRAVATQGIGYPPRLVAVQGLWPFGEELPEGDDAWPFIARRGRRWRPGEVEQVPLPPRKRPRRRRHDEELFVIGV